jgi:hypothetical protein
VESEIKPQQAHVRPGDLQINLHSSGKAQHEKEIKASKKPLFGSGKKAEPKSEAETTPQKAKGGLFGGKKKESPSGVMIGAAAQQPSIPSDKPIDQSQQPTAPIVFNIDDDDKTQINDDTGQFVGLRLVSNQNLPQRIEVRIDIGRTFSIGRFDVAKGVRQSDFEFDKNTKGVSRNHHAVIERTPEGYCVIDTDSSAGTFVNNRKLTSNTPFPIVNGDKVSFGNAGVDYVWES